MVCRARVAVLTLALGLASPLAALSQERIALVTKVDQQVALVEIDASVSGFGQVLSTTSLNGVSTNFFNALATPVALAGGRYLVWLAFSPTQDWDLVVFDRRTKRAFYVGVPPQAPVPGQLIPALAADLVADRRQPRVFYRIYDQEVTRVWSLDARQPSPRLLRAHPRADGGVGPIFIAEGVNQLFLSVVHLSGSPRYEVLVLDATTGRELRRMPADGFPNILGVDANGTTLYTVDVDGEVLARRDAVTGHILHTTPLDGSTFRGADPERNRLYVQGPGRLRALDATTLAEQWRTPLAESYSAQMRIVHSVQPGRWMTGAYVARAESRVVVPPEGYYSQGEYTCNAINLDVYTPDGTPRATLDVMAALNLSGGNGTCAVTSVLVRSPFAPRSLAATVRGHDVALTWDDPGDATGFEVEYGFAPGQRAGSVRLAQGATELTMPNVPPGVYYVRATAVNEVGSSPASNEVRVVVR